MAIKSSKKIIIQNSDYPLIPINTTNLTSWPYSDLESETKTFLKNVKSAGGLISGSTLNAVDDFVKEVKKAGIISKLYDCCLFCGDNLQACLTKIFYPSGKSPYVIGVNFKESDYKENLGLKGDGTSKYLNTQIDCSIFSNQNTSTSVYIRDSVETGYYKLYGLVNGSSSRFCLQAFDIGGTSISDQYDYQYGGRLSGAHGAVRNGWGMLCASRTPQPMHKLFRNGIAFASSSSVGSSSVSSLTGNLYVMACNIDNVPSYFSDRFESFYHFGAGLSDNEVASLYSAVQRFQIALNRDVYDSNFGLNKSISNTDTLKNGLVSYWTCNQGSGNLIDSLGRNTLTNVFASFQNSGKFGYAAILDGRNNGNGSYFSITNANQSGLSSTSSFSISCWYFPFTQPTQAHMLVAKNDYTSGSQRTFQFYYEYYVSSGSNYALTLYTSTNGSNDIGGPMPYSNMKIGAWNHLCVRFDASNQTASIFANGVKIGTHTSMPTTLFSSTASFRIGRNLDLGNVNAFGAMSDIGYWNRPLSDYEFGLLYNDGKGLTY